MREDKTIEYINKHYKEWLEAKKELDKKENDFIKMMKYQLGEEKKEDWKEKLFFMSGAKGLLCKTENGEFKEVEDYQLTFKRRELETFVEQEKQKSYEEGYKKGLQENSRVTITKVPDDIKPVSGYDSSTYLV